MILAQPAYANNETPSWKRIALLLLGCLCLCLLLTGGQAARAQSTPSATASPSRIKSDLKQILSDQEFRPESADESPIARAVEKVRKQFETWWENIRRFFRRLFGEGGGDPGTVNVGLVYTLIAVIAVAALWTLYRIFRTRVSGRGRAVAAVQGSPSPVEQEERPRAPDEWLAEADRLARSRDFRGAFRAVFLAILVQLDRAGKIEYQRSRTNGDYLRALRAHSLRSLYDMLAPLAREFDLRWYGGRPSNEADYQRCLDAYRQLPALMAAGTPAAPPPNPSDATPAPAKGG
jgi:hypothetical protein